MSSEKVKKKPTVLVAEDNVDHLELLSDALSVENDVIGTDSRDGCISLLSEKEFDLVVLDYNLKKKFSGFDILKEITNEFPNLPVIMVTAYGSEDLAVKVMKTGAKDYIRKTLDNNYIERIVNNVRELVIASGKRKKDRANVNAIVTVIRNDQDTFIRKWERKINEYIKRMNIPLHISIDKNQYELVLSSFLADMQNNNAIETTRIFKEFLSKNNLNKSFFFILEMLNISFKDIAIEYIDNGNSSIVKYKSSIYYQIDTIINENSFAIRDIFFNALEVDK